MGSDSTLNLNLSNGSVFTGTVSGSITNGKGSSVSTTMGTVNVTLDSTSKWVLTGDTYISSFSGSAANVITNGYTLYVNGAALSGTTEADSSISDETQTDKTFTDMPEGAWYYSYVTALANAGVINGYTDGSFGPDNTITRAEISRVIYLLMEL